MTTSPLPMHSNGGVLVASPSPSLRERVLSSLPDRHWPVQQVSGGADALVKLESGTWQLLFLDRRLPDLDAEELVEVIKRRFPGIEVVVLDSDGGPVAPAAIRGNWVAKPQSFRTLPDHGVERTGTGSLDNVELEPLPGMIGRSAAMQQLYKLARLVAPRPTTVLISGPTGTGKELVARALHRLSPRSSKPFMVVNCAAIPESLLEAELFGYTRGAFTGAIQAYAGRIQAAQSGTLFLDEVGELPLGLQAKLLRFLDQKEIQRLGSSDTVRADVRVVAATNLDLEQAVEQGRFRSDLYYRLSAFPLHLPSLRERTADVLVLAKHFLMQMAGEIQCPPVQLSGAAAAALEAHSWSGNVRELQQVMERAVILASEGIIQPQHLCFSNRSQQPAFRATAAGHAQF